MESIITAIYLVFNFLMAQLGIVLDTILDNPVLLVPVLFSVFGSIVFFAVKIVRRLGVRARR